MKDLSRPAGKYLRRAFLLSIFSLSSLWARTPVHSDTFRTSAGAVTVEPIEHASLTLEAGGKLIYVDPSPASLFKNRPKAALIVVTDIHPDHLDLAAIDLLKAPRTEIIAPPAAVKSIPGAKALSNGTQTSRDGWSIEAIPMYNMKRGPQPGVFYHPKGRGDGYVLTYGGMRFYIAGDTEGTPEMRALKNIDVAFIPMNLPYTMTPDEAADAVKEFHPNIVYPYHYRNQGGSLADVNKFKADLAGTGIEVRLRDWYPDTRKGT